MQHKWKIKPENVVVAGITYEVKQEVGLVANTNNHGECRHLVNEIVVDKSIPSSRKSQIFCHEMIHAIDNTFANNDTPEWVINGHSEGLWQVLQQWGIEFDWD